MKEEMKGYLVLMDRPYYVGIEEDEDTFVAICYENNVASQGKTKQEALKNVKEALELYLEG